MWIRGDRHSFRAIHIRIVLSSAAQAFLDHLDGREARQLVMGVADELGLQRIIRDWGGVFDD